MSATTEVPACELEAGDLVVVGDHNGYRRWFALVYDNRLTPCNGNMVPCLSFIYAPPGEGIRWTYLVVGPDRVFTVLVAEPDDSD